MLTGLLSCGWYPGVNLAEIRQANQAEEALDNGCHKWHSLGIDNYIWMISESYWGPLHLISVQNGQIEGATVLGGYDESFPILPTGDLPDNYIGTINALCTEGKRQLNEFSDGASIQISDKYGFAENLFIDWKRSWSDEETEIHAAIIAANGKFENGWQTSIPCAPFDSTEAMTYQVSAAGKTFAGYAYSSDTTLEISGTSIYLMDPEWPTEISGTIEIDPHIKFPLCGIRWQSVVEETEYDWPEDFYSILHGSWFLAHDTQTLELINIYDFWLRDDIPLPVHFEAISTSE